MGTTSRRRRAQTQKFESLILSTSRGSWADLVGNHLSQCICLGPQQAFFQHRAGDTEPIGATATCSRSTSRARQADSTPSQRASVT